ncbi:MULTISPECIES: ComEC/Rec2 family competence protein [Corynebacterium]|uniref:ComEC/Rec2 family competence protein n=1 Tax=Corynebacterium TaxID=1716 RepID=UPI00124C4476|nr:MULTISPECIES: ComEC/Rec2 family competence protein [Corynebacterium]
MNPPVAFIELRLIPIACMAWASTWVVVATEHGPLLLAVLGVVAVAAAWAYRAPGSALLLTATVVVHGGVAQLRRLLIQQHPITQARGHYELAGRVISSTDVSGGSTCLTRLRLARYPAELPVFHPCERWQPHRGEHVVASVQLQEDTRVGLNAVVARLQHGRVVGEPSWWDHCAHTVRARFMELVQQNVGQRSVGLIPGMVFGDTSLQSEEETAAYLATGLSHLSAVSGANVAIVTTACVIACRLAGCGPRWQCAAAGIALVAFVVLVGPEPSVKRAAVTGVVGLVAVVSVSRAEPLHALAVAITGLLLWDSDLAVSYGFALSCAATAGIVALHPYLYPRLAWLLLPDVCIRALSVAIAADIVTMPLLALMVGRVSAVAVAANVCVAAAVAPVTIVGLFAVVLVALRAEPLAAVAVRIIEPCTWWIHRCAEFFAGMPWAVIESGSGPYSVVGVVLACCWFLVLLPARRRVAKQISHTQ